MNRALFVIIISVASLFYIFNIDRPFTERFTAINNLKQFYVQQTISLSNFLDTYFSQASTIKELKAQNNELKKFRILYTNSETALSVLQNTIFEVSDSSINLKLSNVLSYVNFDDYTKVWIDFEKKDEKILGLVSQNYAAGIVKNFAGKSLALLNGNEKSNYSVFIGKNKAPGIMHGTYKDNLLSIKFIPIWIEIQRGDEVMTSGMDNVFFEGLKVGKVVGIKKMADMQEAIIEPYAKTLQAEYFYVYKKEASIELPQPKAPNKKP